jgi:hypothetical protein
MPASNSEARKRHDDDSSATLELECGCVINSQYLPLQGGDRYVTCNHGHTYIIRGKVEKYVHMRAERQNPNG